MSVEAETEADTRADRIALVLTAAGWGQNGPIPQREVIFRGRTHRPERAATGFVLLRLTF
jgi:hypothetical protein